MFVLQKRVLWPGQLKTITATNSDASRAGRPRRSVFTWHLEYSNIENNDTDKKKVETAWRQIKLNY